MSFLNAPITFPYYFSYRQIKQTTVKIEIRKKEIAEANLLKRKDEKLGEENVSLKEKIKACEEE